MPVIWLHNKTITQKAKRYYTEKALGTSNEQMQFCILNIKCLVIDCFFYLMLTIETQGKRVKLV